MMDLADTNFRLLSYIYNDPIEAMNELKFELDEYQKQLIIDDRSKENFMLKTNFEFKMKNFPLSSSQNIHRIPLAERKSKLLILNVNVLRVSEKKILQLERFLKCEKCGHTIKQKSPEDQYNIFIKPKSCPGDMCKSTSFICIESSSSTSTKSAVDYQEIKVQELIHKLGAKKIPKSIPVVLHGDLVDCVKPGDQIMLIGILTSRWKSLGKDKPCTIEMYIKANNIEKLYAQSSSMSNDTDSKIDFDDSQKIFNDYWQKYSEKPLTGRDRMLSKICPKLFGMYPLKLAFILQMIGGVQIVKENSKVRGDIHMLLVGDPGTGKSQFLQYVLELFPQAILTTGIGSTNAGLTAAASRVITCFNYCDQVLMDRMASSKLMLNKLCKT